MKITKLFTEFFESEKSAGLLLILCTILSLSISNSSIGENYMHFWHQSIGGMTIEHWINDGLMAIFFFLIGLELEREIYIGELSNLKEALLPIFAAFGGMIVPAGIYLMINWGSSSQSGMGIPMATDIAFALGALSLLGSRVPVGLKVFLTALAVIDDLGAILVIALFYTQDISWIYLGISGLILLILFGLNRLKVYMFLPYLIGGIALWYCMLRSGVHATIAGVLLAFVLPFGKGDDKSLSYKLQSSLHLPVAFFIIPLFALANTAFELESFSGGISRNLVGLGIFFGLVVGKPLGILLFSYITVHFGWSTLPLNTSWKKMMGVSCLAGIGFTMSIFISLLALNDIHLIHQAKLTILISSMVAGVLGYFILKFNLKSK